MVANLSRGRWVKHQSQNMLLYRKLVLINNRSLTELILLISVPGRHQFHWCLPSIQLTPALTMLSNNSIHKSLFFIRIFFIFLSFKHHYVYISRYLLTHWGEDLMAAILQTNFQILYFENQNCCILIQILMKFVPKGSINKKSVLVQVMARCHTGDQPSPEPMLTKMSDAIWSH